MMTVQRVVNYVAAEPFRPFHISMASGKSYNIRHPEMVSVGRTTVRVFTAMSEDPEEAKDREHEISLVLIESVEPLDVSIQHDESRN